MNHPAQNIADTMAQSGHGQLARPSSLRETLADLVALRVQIRHAQRTARPQSFATALGDVAADLSMWIDDLVDLGVERGADDNLMELLAPLVEPSAPPTSTPSSRPVVLALAEMEDVLGRLRRRALSTPRSTPTEQLLVEVARGLRSHIAQLSAGDRIPTQPAPSVH